ncbi:MAG TPA: hypothetical protein VFS20_05640, partial [Longimicrobium sp.]|nr:hypothetical protein [Longimicrobium sp.]
MAMVRELEDEPFGIFVWSAYRLLVTWVAAKRDIRRELYNPGGIEALVLKIAGISGFSLGAATNSPSGGLVLLLASLLEDSPNEWEQALAALTVSEWALSRGFTETALAYSGLAAGLGNTSRHAWLAGRLHRRHARPHEAEAWYLAADAAATREKDWETKARALNSQGRLALDVGRYPDARKLFGRALKVAQRYKLRDREVETHHHLFAVGVATHDHALADQEIERVISGYGPDHPKLPTFAHDLAAYWMDKGDYGNALNVLTTLLERHFKDASASRLLVLGSAARATGGAIKPGMFDMLHAEFTRLRSRGPETLLHAQALLLVARGAASLRRWKLAKECLTEALASSRRTAQKDTEILAEQLLAQVGQQLQTEREHVPSVTNRELARRAI